MGERRYRRGFTVFLLGAVLFVAANVGYITAGPRGRTLFLFLAPVAGAVALAGGLVMRMGSKED